MTPIEAARLTGMKEREVLAVDDTPAGDVIRCFDGTVLLNAVRPDGAGRTGLMFLVAPHDGYHGTFPVYTLPADKADDPADGDDDDVPGEDDTQGGDDVPAKADDVIAWVGDDTDRAVRALEAEEARRGGPRTTVVKALERLL